MCFGGLRVSNKNCKFAARVSPGFDEFAHDVLGAPSTMLLVAIDKVCRLPPFAVRSRRRQWKTRSFVLGRRTRNMLLWRGEIMSSISSAFFWTQAGSPYGWERQGQQGRSRKGQGPGIRQPVAEVCASTRFCHYAGPSIIFCASIMAFLPIVHFGAGGTCTRIKSAEDFFRMATCVRGVARSNGKVTSRFLEFVVVVPSPLFAVRNPRCISPGWPCHVKYHPPPCAGRIQNCWVCLNTNMQDPFDGRFPFCSLTLFDQTSERPLL